MTISRPKALRIPREKARTTEKTPGETAGKSSSGASSFRLNTFPTEFPDRLASWTKKKINSLRPRDLSRRLSCICVCIRRSNNSGGRISSRFHTSNPPRRRASRSGGQVGEWPRCFLNVFFLRIFTGPRDRYYIVGVPMYVRDVHTHR